MEGLTESQSAPNGSYGPYAHIATIWNACGAKLKARALKYSRICFAQDVSKRQTHRRTHDRHAQSVRLSPHTSTTHAVMTYRLVWYDRSPRADGWSRRAGAPSRPLYGLRVAKRKGKPFARLALPLPAASAKARLDWRSVHGIGYSFWYFRMGKKSRVLSLTLGRSTCDVRARHMLLFRSRCYGVDTYS